MDIAIDWSGFPHFDEEYPEQWGQIKAMLEEGGFAGGCTIGNKNFGEITWFHLFDADARSVGLFEYQSETLSRRSVARLEEEFRSLAVRFQLLRTLKKAYNRNPEEPHASRAWVLDETGLDRTDISKGIEYLEGRGLIDVDWRMGDDFEASLNQTGLEIVNLLGATTSGPIKEASRILLEPLARNQGESTEGEFGG